MVVLWGYLLFKLIKSFEMYWISVLERNWFLSEKVLFDNKDKHFIEQCICMNKDFLIFSATGYFEATYFPNCNKCCPIVFNSMKFNFPL